MSGYEPECECIIQADATGEVVIEDTDACVLHRKEGYA